MGHVKQIVYRKNFIDIHSTAVQEYRETAVIFVMSSVPDESGMI